MNLLSNDFLKFKLSKIRNSLGFEDPRDYIRDGNFKCVVKSIDPYTNINPGYVKALL